MTTVFETPHSACLEQIELFKDIILRNDISNIYLYLPKFAFQDFTFLNN